jgi:hypothetical protein
MNGFSIAFVLFNAAALILLPRRWAPLPLLIGACYITLAQGLEIGPFHFTVIRILVAVGLVRVIIRREGLRSGMNSLDRLMLVWAVWALISGVFHADPSAALVFRLGLVYNACGIYFLLRIFCQSLDDIIVLCRVTAILLFPIAVEMFIEQVAVYNLFGVLGGVSEIPAIREGRIRSQGPFAHPILAGTVGAVCLPLMIGLWRLHRKQAVMGIMACCAMVYTSAASGPLTSALTAIGALFVWRWRYRMYLFRWLAVLGYVGLELLMKVPPYYLIARFDLAGGSTGWHRAELIDSALRHLYEWWLVGTDYTRHWMPTGVSWSSDHTDITNQYLIFGVVGGLPLMLMFIAILTKGFSLVGQAQRQPADLPATSRFTIWTLGASLFAHAATSISVSYFDQSFLFLYLTLAAIGSSHSETLAPGSKSDAIVWTQTAHKTIQ